MAASTLLTVGYGDIYPVTTLGKVFGIFITFLGVGMVAIPTGIISAGFVDQYSRLKRRNEYGYEADLLVLGAEPYEDDEHINLKEVVLKTHNPWTGLRIRDLDISRQSIIVLVKRRNKSLIPNGNMKLEAGDRVFIYTKLHLSDANNIEI